MADSSNGATPEVLRWIASAVTMCAGRQAALSVGITGLPLIGHLKRLREPRRQTNDTT
jgi:hypothetical protein